MYHINDTTTLKDGTPVRVIAVSEFEGYATYTVEVSGRTMDVDDSELEAPPVHDRDWWVVILSATVIGGGLMLYVLRELLA